MADIKIYTRPAAELYVVYVDDNDPSKATLQSHKVLSYDSNLGIDNGVYELEQMVPMVGNYFSQYVDADLLNHRIESEDFWSHQYFSFSKMQAAEEYKEMLDEAIEYWKYCEQEGLVPSELSTPKLEAFMKLREEVKY